MDKYRFTKGVEKLIDPISVGTLHFMQSFSGSLPVSKQNQIVKKASENNPLMGFVVEPYCYFMCYEITDREYFQTHLPADFELAACKIFQTDEMAKEYLIIGSFNARTSGFIGSRAESYVTARNTKTGLTSWVIIDYLTNTISYDSKNGLTAPQSNKEGGFVTSNFAGEVVVDIYHHDKHLAFVADINEYQVNPLDEDLWIEGNLSVAYGTKLADDGDLFSLRFDPREMAKAWEMPITSLEVEVNNWFDQYVEATPSKLACFPYAQHFISDAPGFKSEIKNEAELIDNISKVDFSDIKVYSSASFKKAIIIVPLIQSVIIIILLLVIIFR